MDVDARVEALQVESERLRERVIELEAALGLGFVAPLGWQLTATEMRLLGALMARPALTKDGAMAALYRNLGRDEPEPKIVDVMICKLRSKLRPRGFAIETIWGRGYRIDPAVKAQISAAIAAEVAA